MGPLVMRAALIAGGAIALVYMRPELLQTMIGVCCLLAGMWLATVLLGGLGR